MKTPKSLEPLVRDGLIDEVIRPIKSGKEAAVYVVRCAGEVCCALSGPLVGRTEARFELAGVLAWEAASLAPGG